MIFNLVHCDVCDCDIHCDDQLHIYGFSDTVKFSSSLGTPRQCSVMCPEKQVVRKREKREREKTCRSKLKLHGYFSNCVFISCLLLLTV